MSAWVLILARLIMIYPDAERCVCLMIESVLVRDHLLVLLLSLPLQPPFTSDSLSRNAIHFFDST